ncbi:hypothetical protein SAMN04488564_103568 [Lentzea waywayandensis]|uniref:Uncharacterized protein n=1 Tax=Lentzea waywayandensis TaxID=84724 RepID=A0A1I6E1H0_9PSEU|nr:hypothetical protein [Lentzea waywayandensis]SFR11368.1 hypothetical protein SAMN04488564_103568 [Lentzea waywayandensis]
MARLVPPYPLLKNTVTVLPMRFQTAAALFFTQTPWPLPALLTPNPAGHC